MVSAVCTVALTFEDPPAPKDAGEDLYEFPEMDYSVKLPAIEATAYSLNRPKALERSQKEQPRSTYTNAMRRRPSHQHEPFAEVLACANYVNYY